MVKRTLDVLSVAAVLVVMVVIIYVSSALIDGRFYEEDVRTSWEDITESFYRWEYAEKAKEQPAVGEVEFHDEITVVSVINVNGAVSISTWDNPYVYVEYDRSEMIEDFYDDVYAEIVQKNSKVEIATHYRPNVPGVSGSVEYTVYVPEGIKEIMVNTISGDVDLHGIPEHTGVTITMVSSRVHIEGGKSLRVRGVSGSVDFSIHGGSAKIDVYSTPVRGTFSNFYDQQSLAIKTHSGSINLLFPAELDNVEYHVKTEEGTIYLSPALTKFKKDSTVNEAKGVIGTAENSIILESVRGNINLKLVGDDDELLSIDQLETAEEIPALEEFEGLEEVEEIEEPDVGEQP